MCVCAFTDQRYELCNYQDVGRALLHNDHICSSDNKLTAYITMLESYRSLL